MSERWNKPGIPHKGWRHEGVEDVEQDYVECEMCGHEKVRYAHYLSHPEYTQVLRVGCVCAGKMIGDYVDAEAHDRRARMITTKRANLHAKTWKRSAKGNLYLKIDGRDPILGGIVLVIFPDKYNEGKWEYGVDGQFTQRRYNTSSEAKNAAIDAVLKLLTTEREEEV